MTASNVAEVESQVSDGPDDSAIETWIQQRIADVLEVEVAMVDLHRPIAAYGIDSVDAAYLVGDLESWLGRSIPGEFVWEWGSVREIARRLAVHLKEA